MPNRTQIVCLHEGKRGPSIDPVFINRLINNLQPPWVRPWKGNNIVRLEPCGGRAQLITRFPQVLQQVLQAGGSTTLMVWADVDDKLPDCDTLKNEFWKTAQMHGINQEQFNNVAFIFAKDRIENWVEFLTNGNTDESTEGPRVNNKQAADAANKLAEFCRAGVSIANIPPSLEWSCRNWRVLRDRMAG